MLTLLQKRVAQEMTEYSQGGDYWCISPETGVFLYNLVLKNYCRYAVECGSGIGFSSLWIAAALQQNRGKLVGFEFYPPKCQKAEEFIKKARLGNTVEFICASAHKGIPHLARGVDFVFLDARKCDYLKHFKQVRRKCKKGAIIAADNITSHAEKLQDYLHYVRSHHKSEFKNIGTGLEVTYI